MYIHSLDRMKAEQSNSFIVVQGIVWGNRTPVSQCRVFTPKKGDLRIDHRQLRFFDMCWHKLHMDVRDSKKTVPLLQSPGMV